MKNSRAFVVYWNNIPTPYMVERFNAIVDQGEYEFEAWFNDRIEPDRSWAVDESSWRFRYRYIPKIALGKYRFRIPIFVLGRRPDVLVSLYAEPAFVVGWLVAKIRGTKTAFWAEVTFDSWVPRRLWKNVIKKLIFEYVDAIITVGQDGRRFALKYGASEDKIRFAPHVIDVDHFALISAEARQKRGDSRSEWGLRGITFMYVGRLWWGKGVSDLLEAYRQVQQLSEAEVSLLLVGDGPEEGKLAEMCRKDRIRNVVFAGFRQKAELPRLYALADVFVFPTLGDPYGLVVDEAMACSLPVISTSAAGEIRDRIHDGRNGYIVPPNDIQGLSERMLELSRDASLRAQMGYESAKLIAGHTPSRWARDFGNVIKEMINA